MVVRKATFAMPVLLALLAPADAKPISGAYNAPDGRRALPNARESGMTP